MRFQGKVGFLGDVLPGEQVRFEVITDRPARFEADLREVLVPAPARVTPPCRYYGKCGGCDLQHIEYGEQTRIKRGIVLEDLKRLGGIEFDPEQVLLHSAAPWAYRGRVQIHTDATGNRGFKARRSGEIIPIHTCLVVAPEIDLLFREDPGFPPESRVTAVVGDQGVARGDRDSLVSRTIGGVRFDFDPRAFSQSNWSLLDRLGEALRARVRRVQPEAILDLYAGAGLLAVLAVAENNRVHVTCVEPVGDNVRFARENLLRAGVAEHGIDIWRTTAERALSNRKFRRKMAAGSDRTLVIVDPPREGLSRVVREGLLTTNCEDLVYLSCNSAALARDLKVLREVYRIESLQVFDFFPHTSHVEVLVDLKKND